jgi:hypothetical protein
MNDTFGHFVGNSAIVSYVPFSCSTVAGSALFMSSSLSDSGSRIVGAGGEDGVGDGDGNVSGAEPSVDILRFVMFDRCLVPLDVARLSAFGRRNLQNGGESNKLVDSESRHRLGSIGAPRLPGPRWKIVRLLSGNPARGAFRGTCSEWPDN